MKRNFKKIVFAFLLGTVAFTSCNKYLDINQNPNYPETAEPRLLLPTVQASIGQILGNQLQVYGGLWAQVWTQNPTSSQYITIDQYNIKSTATNSVWANIYRYALYNAQIIIQSESTLDNYYKGIAHLLKAYTFQVATDAFGDIPLDEALQGVDYRSPKYQSQKEVYTQILADIDKGVELLNSETGTNPGQQDMYFGGDLESWKAFANTLKLKAYLRLSEVDASAVSAGIKALYATNPKFLDKNVSITYTTTGGNENPLYNEMIGLRSVQNLVASGTVVKAFVDNNDPRRFKLFDRLSEQDTIAYIEQGDFRANTKKRVSPPSALVGANVRDAKSALAPANLFTRAESYFLQSEAAYRGWATADAEETYNKGIEASFAGLGLSAEDLKAYMTKAKFPEVKTQQLEAIITQKYFALAGFQNFEAWNEWRRTGYPKFFIVSKGSVIGSGQMPQRLIYPNSEATSNANFPGLKPLTDRVWWDVK